MAATGNESAYVSPLPPKVKLLRYLLVLDFEATCDDGPAKLEPEIIEFPTLLYDIQQKKVINQFHSYVKPIRNPILTTFCTTLTGIEQDTVAAAPPFPEVYKSFQNWLVARGLAEKATDDTTSHMAESSPWIFLTCGDWDLKTMLPSQLGLTSVLDPNFTAEHPAIPDYMNRWINVKDAYNKTRSESSHSVDPATGDSAKQRKKAKKSGGPGMAGMLSGLGLKLEGRHHSGIDDCRNIARIVTTLIQKGWDPNTPAKT